MDTVTTIDGTEYPYECACGETYSNIDAAICCRKCRTYTNQGYCDEVIDLRHGGIVWTSNVVYDWAWELSGAQGKWPTLATVWN